MKIFDEARGFIKDKRYTKISDRMMDIGTNNVVLQVKAGRSILTCSCSNSGRFGDNNLCSHKLVFLIVSFNSRLYHEIDKQINQVETYKGLNLPINNMMCLDILEKIKRAE